MIPTIDKVKTGKNIKRLLYKNHITPNHIKEYLNLSCVQTVYRWLEGINIPSVDNLYAISKLLGVSMDDLMIGTGDEESCCNKYEMQARLNMYYNRVMRLKTA